jgi:hypothetical protein
VADDKFVRLADVRGTADIHEWADVSEAPGPGGIPRADEDGVIHIPGNVTIDGDVLVGGTIVQESGPRWGTLTLAVAAEDLVDGGGATGTATSSDTIPAGALIFATAVTQVTGFAGDVSAIIKIGDGTDDDRFNTGTPSVFATAANGVEVGRPSGDVRVRTAVHVVATITSSTDIGLVISNGGGGLFVEVAYFLP